MINYASIISPKVHGLTNRQSTFKTFELPVNKQFGIVETGPIDRNTKRVGALGYKIGMTHFWNKWGQFMPCTVIQLDRCQVVQVKTKENDGVNSI